MGSKASKKPRAGREQVLPFERFDPGRTVPPGLVGAHRNNVYSVLTFRSPSKWGEILTLIITRLDRQPVRNRKHIQKVKDMLVSPMVEAVEIFPSKEEAERFDVENATYLWVLPKGKRLPFGLGKSEFGGTE